MQRTNLSYMRSSLFLLHSKSSCSLFTLLESISISTAGLALIELYETFPWVMNGSCEAAWNYSIYFPKLPAVECDWNPSVINCWRCWSRGDRLGSLDDSQLTSLDPSEHSNKPISWRCATIWTMMDVSEFGLLWIASVNKKGLGNYYMHLRWSRIIRWY